jgi:serine/threonine-protein kinase
VEIARRLCAGLAAAHDKGVLHRDLKPGNIMIDGRGQVRIMDFGLARLAEETRGAEMRNGTPAYMAPEQSAGREVSVRSDLYALGLVLFEMFTGKRAFPDDHNHAPIRSSSSTGNEVDPAVERIVLRCLEPEPRNRPASALAVAAALPYGDPLAEALAAGKHLLRTWSLQLR